MKLVDNLRYLEVKFVSPFKLEVNGDEHQMQLLIKGFGAKNGMIVEKSWEKIQPISAWLTSHEYSFSCFNPEEPSSLADAKELLEDWGRI